MDKRLFFILLMWTTFVTTWATTSEDNDKEQQWSVKAGIGTSTAETESSNNRTFYSSPDASSNLFYLQGDYYLTPKLTLSGGVYFEQTGLLDNFSQDIGLLRVNTAGLTVGSKYYFLPKKWVVQAYAGAFAQTNFLNLKRTTGKKYYVSNNQYRGAGLDVNYDIQRPALSIVPQVGLDLRIFSSVSLCVDFNYQFGLWGHQCCDFRFNSGPLQGVSSSQTTSNIKPGISFGVKVDFPMRKFTSNELDNLLEMLFNILSGPRPQDRYQSPYLR